ncbi:hypothetical protein AK830_g2003 [Neonectria ditissima]|uniref:SET domain-containing protein n=1 Tax=Neonectria ditissima TaxID=78410 RepID=A0A0N8H8G7_9HYPO|nr:hypothetical protein AK830_g2003 [Neonectria ditissima]
MNPLQMFEQIEKDNRERGQQCRICEKWVRGNRAHLEDHVRTHTGLRTPRIVAGKATRRHTTANRLERQERSRKEPLDFDIAFPQCELCQTKACQCIITEISPARPKIVQAGVMGEGVQATVRYEVGEYLGEFLGELVPLNSVNNGWSAYMSRDDINSDAELRPVCQVDCKHIGNWGRKVNHSCEANTEFVTIPVSGKWRILIKAVKVIEAGDVVTGPSCLCVCFVAPRGVGGEFSDAKEASDYHPSQLSREATAPSLDSEDNRQIFSPPLDIGPPAPSQTAVIRTFTPRQLPETFVSPSTGTGAGSMPHGIEPSPSAQSPPVQTTCSDFASPEPKQDEFLQLQQRREGIGLTERQAFLFMIYTHRLAPSSDACDEARHFTLEVPRLALREPMIMNGILALASVYDSRCSDSTSDLESTYYHNKCIELLIEAFTRPPETWDSNLLTAVVIARLYEEYDNEKDSDYHHLSGTQNLLNHGAIARFVMQGGLAEAASWVHLRQAIYVYLVRREPVDICLENFERSTVFQRTDDSAYTNRIVHLFARLMKLLFPTSGQQTATGKQQECWRALQQQICSWNDTKPLSFQPIYCKPSSLEEDRPFPTMCIAASVPVIATQYYYAAKAVICLHECNSGDEVAGFNSARLRHDGEPNDQQRIAAYLGILMGLALSNEHAINAFYLPSHMLSLCGYCIRDPCERKHAIQYLWKVHAVLKWKTQALAQMLESQWTEMDSFEIR